MVLEFIKSVILGIVEGVTEWLPVSSTGHLILVNQFLNLHLSDNETVNEGFIEMFDVVIQLGAIMAVVVLFWKKLFPFGKDLAGTTPHIPVDLDDHAVLLKDRDKI